jgi:hypothetical protein
MGPKDLPIVLVPNFCTKNREEMIRIAIGRMGILGLIIKVPSIAETMVIAGVMIPSESNVAPPIIANIKAHFALFLISANRAKIPPSPLLSALSVIIMYFKVACMVNAQKTQERPPRMNNSEIESAP